MSRDPLRLTDYLEHILESVARIHVYYFSRQAPQHAWVSTA